jgi:hypothetical protein
MTKWEKSCGGKFAKRLLLRPAAGRIRANNGALDNKAVIYLPRLYLSKSRDIPYFFVYIYIYIYIYISKARFVS